METFTEVMFEFRKARIVGSVPGEMDRIAGVEAFKEVLVLSSVYEVSRIYLNQLYLNYRAIEEGLD